MVYVQLTMLKTAISSVFYLEHTGKAGVNSLKKIKSKGFMHYGNNFFDGVLIDIANCN